MSILTSQLPNSNLGLKNQTPPTFGATPLGIHGSATALHDTFSTNGTPTISFNSSNSARPKLIPSQLDDIKATLESPYTPGAGSYLQNLPQ
jgi:hypothetical protein